MCVFRCSAGLGVLLLLPLVDFHLSECLESLCSSAAAAAVTPGAPALEPWRLEAGLTGFSVEEVALAALRLLHLLVSHSDEVIFQPIQFRQKHMSTRNLIGKITNLGHSSTVCLSSLCKHHPKFLRNIFNCSYFNEVT